MANQNYEVAPLVGLGLGEGNHGTKGFGTGVSGSALQIYCCEGDLTCKGLAIALYTSIPPYDRRSKDWQRGLSSKQGKFVDKLNPCDRGQ